MSDLLMLLVRHAPDPLPHLAAIAKAVHQGGSSGAAATATAAGGGGAGAAAAGGGRPRAKDSHGSGTVVSVLHAILWWTAFYGR